jgi:hypothetical protein
MRTTPQAAASVQSSEKVWVMKLMETSTYQGESASRSAVVRAARRSSVKSRTRQKASHTPSPPSTGFTSHGTPSRTPSASTAGQAG